MNVSHFDDCEQKPKKEMRRVVFSETLELHRLPKSYWDDAEPVSKGKLLKFLVGPCPSGLSV